MMLERGESGWEGREGWVDEGGRDLSEQRLELLDCVLYTTACRCDTQLGSPVCATSRSGFVLALALSLILVILIHCRQQVRHVVSLRRRLHCRCHRRQVSQLLDPLGQLGNSASRLHESLVRGQPRAQGGAQEQEAGHFPHDLALEVGTLRFVQEV